jgi:hypothetical protein
MTLVGQLDASGQQLATIEGKYVIVEEQNG